MIARYEAAALQVAQSAAFKDYLASQSYEALAADGTQFGKIAREGLAKWERGVRERGTALGRRDAGHGRAPLEVGQLSQTSAPVASVLTSHRASRAE